MEEIVLHVWASPHGEGTREIFHAPEIQDFKDLFAQYEGVRCESVNGNIKELPAVVRSCKSSGAALKVIHISAHGETSGILLEDGVNTETAHTTPERLRQLLSGVQVPLLVLGACHSSDIAQHLCDAKVCEHAIGTTVEIQEAVLSMFTEVLYTRLLQGVDLSEAFNEACVAAKSEDFVLLPRIALHDMPILSATKISLKMPHNLPLQPASLNYEASARYVVDTIAAITAAHRGNASSAAGGSAALMRAVSSAPARAILLEGLESGVGSSWVALAAAHRLGARKAPAVSGGIVWVQCAGVDSSPSSPGVGDNSLWTRIAQCVDTDDNGAAGLGLKKTPNGGGATDAAAQAKQHVLRCLSSASRPHLLVLDNVPYCECLLQASCRGPAAPKATGARCSLARPGTCAARVLAALLGLEPSASAGGSGSARVELPHTCILLTTTVVPLPHPGGAAPPEGAYGSMEGAYGGMAGLHSSGGDGGYYGGMQGVETGLPLGGGGYGGMLGLPVALPSGTEGSVCDLGALAAASAAASPGCHPCTEPVLCLPVSIRKGLDVCRMITHNWATRYPAHDSLSMSEFRWAAWRDCVFEDADPTGCGSFTGEALLGRAPHLAADVEGLYGWNNAVSAAAAAAKQAAYGGAAPPSASRNVPSCPCVFEEDAVAKLKMFAPLGNFRALAAFVDLLTLPGARVFTVSAGHTRRLRSNAINGKCGAEPSYLGSRGTARTVLLPEDSKPVQLPVAAQALSLSGALGALSLSAQSPGAHTPAYTTTSTAATPLATTAAAAAGYDDEDDPREPEAGPAATAAARLSPGQRAAAAVAAAVPLAPALAATASAYLQLPAAPAPAPRAAAPPDPFWYLDRGIDRHTAAALLLSDFRRHRATGGFIVRSSSEGPQFLAISVNSRASSQASDGQQVPAVDNYKLTMLPGGGLVSDSGMHFRSLAELLTSQTGKDMNMLALVHRDGSRTPKEAVALRCTQA